MSKSLVNISEREFESFVATKFLPYLILREGRNGFYSYGIFKALRERGISMSICTVYATVRLLKDGGYVRAFPKERRVYYRNTKRGEKLLETYEKILGIVKGG